MPNDVKAIVSLITILVALALVFWGGSPVKQDFSLAVILTAVFMVAAMWVFPEAGVKKGDIEKSRRKSGTA